MTHSLHRVGSIDDLREDFVILAMLAAGINDKYPDSRQKLIRIAEILNQHNPTNIMPNVAWEISPVITAVFTDINTIKQIIQTLKREDLGVSIVISGLISEIKEVVEEIGLNMHTVHLSLGTFGKKELLPSETILEITTMCGHHCTSQQSIEYYIDLIKEGKITVEKAAKKLARPCICGIFNISRATKILSELVNHL
ncbi:MAG: hypothetical protein ACFE8A_11470 [Candidatus Hodarchaeota archaeon]